MRGSRRMEKLTYPWWPAASPACVINKTPVLCKPSPPFLMFILYVQKAHPRGWTVLVVLHGKEKEEKKRLNGNNAQARENETAVRKEAPLIFFAPVVIALTCVCCWMAAICRSSPLPPPPVFYFSARVFFFRNMHTSDRSLIPTWWPRSFRKICMIYSSFCGLGTVRSAWSSTCLLVWICTVCIQTLRTISQRQL